MPSDILTPEQIAEIAETARVAGNPEMNDHLTDVTLRRKCAESIDALLASHAALRAERDALGEEARCFDAVAESLGVDSTEERFWVDENTKDTNALMEAVKARIADLKKGVQHGH